MTTTPPPADATVPGPLTSTDHRAFAFLGGTNSCLRQCLCTLARHGVALRRREPERARVLLDTVRPWPLYKGGQFLFDLMEWEDLMIDGEPPPLMSRERIVSACVLPVQWLAAATAQAPTAAKLIPGQRTANALDLPLRLLVSTARTALQGAAQDLTDLLSTPAPHVGPDDTGHGTTSDAAADDAADDERTDDEPPPLEAGFYLYEDVTLGALVVLGPLLADHAPTDPAHPA
ncbi:hypothetical protein [Streptomyces griseochromogenes]|uniref:hypothetical protein n=1 Tax=Streptomyces griseochromogenes TaxID=68214 RepID=UPI00378AC149